MDLIRIRGLVFLLNSGDDSESPVPEPLDSGVNTSDDSCESWISAESEFDNSSGDLMDTSQSCVGTWSIPLELHNDGLVLLWSAYI